MSSDELMAFYEDCFTVLSKQEFLLPNREAMYCAIQAVRAVLIEYAQTKGKSEMWRIIKYVDPKQVISDSSCEHNISTEIPLENYELKSILRQNILD